MVLALLYNLRDRKDKRQRFLGAILRLAKRYKRAAYRGREFEIEGGIYFAFFTAIVARARSLFFFYSRRGPATV